MQWTYFEPKKFFVKLIPQGPNHITLVKGREATQWGQLSGSYFLGWVSFGEDFEKVGREDDIWEPKVTRGQQKLFTDHFILQAQTMFWERTRRHLHLLDRAPIVCSLPSQ